MIKGEFTISLCLYLCIYLCPSMHTFAHKFVYPSMHTLSTKNKNHLQVIVNKCSKSGGTSLQSLASYYEQQVLSMGHKIMVDITQPVNYYFEWVPLG